MARPLLNIDAEQVEKLAALHCTNKEIADFFECSTDTIEHRFSAELSKGRSKGKMALRDMQWKAAQKGNVVMMIWLGKQMLAQQDRAHIELAKIPDDVFLAEAQKRLEDGSDKS